MSSTAPSDIRSPWVSGPMAPVTEEVTAVDLPVTGSVPEALRGRLLRNGPNPIAEVDPVKHHWFTGDGMVHGIRLRDGRAEWYRNRWVRSPGVADALGEPSPPTPYDPSVPSFGANTNVISHTGRTLAIVEGGSPPVELTDELETVGPTDFDGTLEHPFSAHPKRDPATGELHVATYFWGWGDRIRYLVVGGDGRVSHTADIDVGGQPMMHDISITETRVVLYDLPCTFDMELAMTGESFPYRWNPRHHARLGVLPLGGSADEVVWIEIEPCYVFHPVNAYDDGDRIVVDVVRWESMFATDVTGPNDGVPRLERWTLDPVAGSMTSEIVDDRGQELPRVDERVVGRRHRHAWVPEIGSVFQPGGALHHDLDRGTTERHDYGPGRSTGELVFVPAHADAAEDEGWLLSCVHDRSTDRSDVVILDAGDFTGEPVATVHLPVRVPVGFHGNWVSDDTP